MNDLQQRIPDAQATSVDEAQVKSFLSRANELIDQNLLTAAQDVVEEGLSVLGENAELLHRLANICMWKDHREEALGHMTRAQKISPNDPSIVSGYIDMLAALNLEREAINYSDELPPDVRAHTPVRLALGGIYASAGWHALATDTYGESKGYYTFYYKRRVWRNWWRSGGPIPQIRRFVRNKDNEARSLWNMYAEDLVVLDTLERPKGFTLRLVRGQVDRYYRRWSLYATWISTIGRLFDNFVGPSAAIIAFVATFVSIVIAYPHTERPFAALAAGAITVIAIAIQRLVWVVDNKISQRAALIMIPLVIVLSIAIGLFLLQQSSKIFAWSTLLGIALVAEAFIICCEIIAIATIRVARYLKIGNLKRAYAREAILDYMMDTVSEMSEPDNRNNLDDRGIWLSRLEFSAQLIEKDLPTMLRTGNAQMNLWLSERARGAAAAIRHMSQRIATPTADSWDNLISTLRDEMEALASGEFASLRWIPPPVPPSRPIRVRNVSVTVARTVVVMATPIVAIILLQPILKLTGADFGWAKLGGLGWAVLYLLITLDPTLNDKISTARNLAGMARELKPEQQYKSSSAHTMGE